jgi:hypothetical protein
MNILFEQFKTMVATKYPELPLNAPKNLSKNSYLKRRVFELLLGTLIILSGQNFLYAEHYSLILWPSTGVGLAMLFLRGQFMVLPIFLGCFGAGLLQGWPWLENFLTALGFAIYLWSSYRLSLRLIGPIQPVLNIIVLSKWISLLMICSLIFVYGLGFIIHNSPPTLNFTCKMTLLAMNGILGLTPFALMLDPFTFRNQHYYKNQFWWIYSLIAVISLMCIGLFYPGYMNILCASLVIIGTFFAYHYGQIPTGLTLLAIATVFIGLNINIWQEHHFLPIYFFLLCMLSLNAATLTAQKL